MRRLKLVGLSEDGRDVLLVDDAGTEFAMPADDRLRAALRGDRARLGQLEIEMDSALRPRDIQARIRAGDSPETVASLAQVSVERIMPFAVPVLAEREHMAQLARRSHVRRKNADGPARKLDDVVVERLRSRNVDPAGTQWDAWRRDDGRWSVRSTYQSGERERSAVFVFDAMGRYSVAEDDEAKWLTGEKQSTSKGPQPRESGQGGRRLAAVPDDADLLSLSEEDASDDLTAVVRAVSGPQTAAPPEVAEPEQEDEVGPDQPGSQERPAEASDDAGTESGRAGAAAATEPAEPQDRAEPATDEPATDEPPAEDAATAAAPDDEPKVEPTPQRRRKSKRASVPSWDEIMFGGRDSRE